MATAEDIRKQIGMRLKGTRHDKALTLQQVAEASGIDLTTISKVESGSRNVSIDCLTKIAKALGLKLGFININ